MLAFLLGKIMSTIPTKNPVPSESASDLKFNAGKVDEFVTSSNHFYADRFGKKHYTIDGINYLSKQAMLNYGYITKRSFESGNTIINPNDVLLWESSGEYYRWDGELPKVVSAGSTPESAGGIGDGKWKSVGDSSLRLDLKTVSGSEMIGYSREKRYDSGTVGDELNKINSSRVNLLNISDFKNLKDAVSELTDSGGIIYVPIGRWDAGDWSYDRDYMNTPNVKIIGEKMPTYSDDLTSLVGGSVITGRFNAWADNFHVEDIGFDLGLAHCESKYPDLDYTKATHPNGGTWDGFAFASPQDGSRSRKNTIIKNVIGLLPAPDALGHAVLCEGIQGGEIDNIIAIYGIHGAVFKILECNVSNVKSYGQKTNGTIIKSDSYAKCGDSSFSGLMYKRKPDGTVPKSTIPPVQFALNINTGLSAFSGSIHIADTHAVGADRHVQADGNFPLSDVTIGSVRTEGVGDTQFSVVMNGNKSYVRFSIGQIIASNCKNGIFVRQPSITQEQQLHIGSLMLTNIAGDCIVANSFSLIMIGLLDIRTTRYAYNIDPSAYVYVGKERIRANEAKFNPAGVNPSLLNGWVNHSDVNESFGVNIEGYKIQLNGLIRGGNNKAITNLSRNILPTKSKRFIVPYMKGSTLGTTYIEVDRDGVKLGDESIISGLTWLSLDGISWNY